ncbi:nucleotidyltransferase [Streptomyces sp. NPDC060194]|uniref:nucleotidyltransferase n=1 Tax=Streptomyces sp. NPDC060194 TaxID=3347069 RepID=UPI00364F71C6
MTHRGLAPDGTIAREGALDRVPPLFAPVIEAARTLIATTFGPPGGPLPDRPGRPPRLHSAYLYGSIPRGTALLGVSDLDLQLALHHEPTETDRADARALEKALDDAFPQIDGVGILLTSRATLLSDLERHDLGFFVACLCTPLLGPDLARDLPRYRPTTELARETNGDLALLLPRWRARAADAATDTARRTLCRAVARRLVRTGFTLVMPRWNGWTSDLTDSATIFGDHYPARAPQMRTAATLARTPSPDPAALDPLLEDLAPWLAAEYATVHGTKTPRP